MISSLKMGVLSIDLTNIKLNGHKFAMLTSHVANDKRKRVGVIARKQYLVDVGMLAIIFLNYVKLALGEAIYLDANVPLAYLSSKIIECMVVFDNVMNHTIVPQHTTLCSIVT